MSYDRNMDDLMRGKCKRDGYGDNLDEWADALQAAADELELANAADDEERERIEWEHSKRRWR